MPETGSTSERYERLKKARDLVRRTALLLSADLPLPDIFGQLAVLLSVFVDASIVQVAVGDASEARMEFVFRDGAGGRPLDSTVRPDGTSARVLREGEPVLYRDIGDWPDVSIVTSETRETRRAISAIFVPISFGGLTVGVLSVQSRRTEAYDEEDVAMLESCAVYLGARLHDEEQRAASEGLKRLATTDALTGLANRRSFDDTLTREWQRCARSGSSLALAMIDVDHFKKFNDAYGHVAGDACLRQIAQAIAGCVKRPGDLAARYGGEEFALVLPESDAPGAIRLAEGVCQAVRGIAVAHQGSSLGYASLSIGVAILVPNGEGDPQSLVAAADAMLYEAKNGGRNRVASDGHRSESPAAQAKVIVRHNLPSYLTEGVGQDRDRAEIATMLQTSRLVNIVGPGGIGKTRLAVEAALQLVGGSGDGVWFVDLSPLDDPAFVPSAIAKVFDVADEGGAPLIERIGNALKAKKLLLVLDNCEHVLWGATAAADALLHTCSDLRVLATSREPLGVAGERSYRMPTLPVPPEAEMMTAHRAMQYAAVSLFVARAQAAQHTFALTDENAVTVADIVRRLDGIALAIELAAPRVRVLSVQQLGQRLDERFKLLTGGRTAHSRQQTLHALIDWSYDLLGEEERIMLRQSSVFRGGWSLEAAEAICNDDRYPDWSAFELVSSLVDKSLVAVESEGEEQHYRLLESTREFAAKRLDEAGEREAIAARHCGYFARLAELHCETFWQTDSDVWIARVRRDEANYRAAINWGLAAGNDGIAAAGIVGSLRWLWFWTARPEGRTLVARAAAALPENAPVRVRGALTLSAARLDQTPRASEPAAEAARLLAGVDESARAEAISQHAYAVGRAGRVSQAVELLDVALALARDIHRPRLVGWVLAGAVEWLSRAGDFVRARLLSDEAAAFLRGCSDGRQLLRLHVNSVEIFAAESDWTGALARAREAEALSRERRDDIALMMLLPNAAGYLLALERFDEAWNAAREGLELGLRIDNAIQISVALGHLSHLAVETGGDAARATRLLGHVDGVFGKTGYARDRSEQHGYDRALELVRTELPPDRIASLMAEGSAMDRGAAVAEALAIPQRRAQQASKGA